MAYELIAGYGMSDLSMADYKLLDPNISIATLALKYKRVYFELEVVGIGNKVVLDIVDIPNYKLLPFDIVSFLLTNGNNSLKVTEGEIPNITKTAKYINISKSNIPILSHNIDFSISERILDHIHKDLVLNFNEANIVDEVFDESLFFVDGCAVRADKGDNYLYLLDATKDKEYRDYEVGCINFSDFGGFTYNDINFDNTYQRDLRENTASVVYIDLDKPIGEGTVFLSLLGYLYIDSDVVTVVGDKTLKVSLYRTEFIEKILYLLGRGQFSLSDFGLPEDTAIDLGELTSREVMKIILNHSSTFVGVINEPGVKVLNIDLVNVDRANQHETGVDYMAPVFYDNGLFCNYQRRKTDKGYSITGNRGYVMENSANYKHRYKLDKLIDARRVSYNPFKKPTVHMKLIHKVE